MYTKNLKDIKEMLETSILYTFELTYTFVRMFLPYFFLNSRVDTMRLPRSVTLFLAFFLTQVGKKKIYAAEHNVKVKIW